jgi:hypothetical protein
MPRYEIVAHVTRELDCASAEEAATEFRRQLLTDAQLADTLLHLAVWREDPAPAASPLPSSLRQNLEDFFSGLERCAGEAEKRFVVVLRRSSWLRHQALGKRVAGSRFPPTTLNGSSSLLSTSLGGMRQGGYVH